MIERESIRRGGEPQARDSRAVAAGAAGWLLRAVDRLCALGYMVFSVLVLRDLWRSAEAHGWEVLVLAVPVVIGTALFAPSVFGRTGRLLQPPNLGWRRGRSPGRRA